MLADGWLSYARCSMLRWKPHHIPCRSSGRRGERSTFVSQPNQLLKRSGAHPRHDLASGFRGYSTCLRGQRHQEIRPEHAASDNHWIAHYASQRCDQLHLPVEQYLDRHIGWLGRKSQVLDLGARRSGTSTSWRGLRRHACPLHELPVPFAGHRAPGPIHPRLEPSGELFLELMERQGSD